MGGSTSKESRPEVAHKTSATSATTPVSSEDYNSPLKKTTLPKDLQDIVDREDTFFDQLYEGYGGESTDSNVRYAAYAARARTILLSAHRYVAYTSDIGESFRPIAHPYLVKGAYGISWAYLIGDVSHEGYKAYCRQQRLVDPNTDSSRQQGKDDSTTSGPNSTKSEQLPKDLATAERIPAIEDYRAVMLQRAVFQSIASMGLPAFTIHSIVRYSGKALKDVKNARLRTWGPIGLGLAAVPALPFMFDKPVEEAVEWTFHKAFEAIGGPSAVRGAPVTGRERKLALEARKEL